MGGSLWRRRLLPLLRRETHLGVPQPFIAQGTNAMYSPGRECPIVHRVDALYNALRRATTCIAQGMNAMYSPGRECPVVHRVDALYSLNALYSLGVWIPCTSSGCTVGPQRQITGCSACMEETMVALARARGKMPFLEKK